jgi:hypothetical protein
VSLHYHCNSEPVGPSSEEKEAAKPSKEQQGGEDDTFEVNKAAEAAADPGKKSAWSASSLTQAVLFLSITFLFLPFYSFPIISILFNSI